MEPIWLAHYEPERARHASTYPDGPLQQFLEAAARDYPDNIATELLRRAHDLSRDRRRGQPPGPRPAGPGRADRATAWRWCCPTARSSSSAIMPCSRPGASSCRPTRPISRASSSTSSPTPGVRTVITLNLFVPAIQEIQAETAIQELIVTPRAGLCCRRCCPISTRSRSGARARRCTCRRGPASTTSRALIRADQPGLHARARRGRRPGAAAIHRRHHRHVQGRHADPPQPGRQHDPGARLAARRRLQRARGLPGRARRSSTSTA